MILNLYKTKTTRDLEERQKLLIQKEIEAVKKHYEDRMDKFLGLIPTNKRMEVTEGTKEYFKEIWWQDYEPYERQLQTALIKFEKRYE